MVTQACLAGISDKAEASRGELLRGDADGTEPKLRVQSLGERGCLAAIGQATYVDPINGLALLGETRYAAGIAGRGQTRRQIGELIPGLPPLQINPPFAAFARCPAARDDVGLSSPLGELRRIDWGNRRCGA